MIIFQNRKIINLIIYGIVIDNHVSNGAGNKSCLQCDMDNGDEK